MKLATIEENPEVLSMLVTLLPIGRLGNHEGVAELVIWFSSKAPSLAYGAYYAMDLGYKAQWPQGENHVYNC